MKVLLQTRPDFQKNPAGDTVQVIETGRALTRLGVEVSLSTDPNALLTNYDLIHIFNITRIKESYYYFFNARKQKKPVVISPIYWNPQQYLQRQGAKATDLAAWKLTGRMRARLVKECELLLPNSRKEAECLKEDFKDIASYQVVPNGFPEHLLSAGSRSFRERFPGIPEKFILSVARISPRKNQLWLARSCQELGLPLVIAGPINDRNYGNLVRSVSNVIYVGTLQGEMLASAYASAAVHALPSWFETPGLSSLEAAACGSAVVISTDQGSPQEYFLDHALYVNPQNETSLPHALQKSLDFSPQPLTEHIRRNYPWAEAGRKTLIAYQKVL